MTTFNGMMCSAHSFYDEGIDHALDLMQEHCATNAIAVYPYQGMTPACRPDGALADHGRPIPRERERQTHLWCQVDESLFAGTTLRHGSVDPDIPYAGKDIFADLREPLASRGMTCYARILEGWTFGFRPGFFAVHEIDAHGRVTDEPCFNNPDYQAFWIASTHNLVRHYPWLRGIYYGAERSSPLSSLLAGRSAGCFCRYCREVASAQGVDPERAANGYRRLQALASELRSDGPPSDGAFVTIMREFVAYPEILAWERLWFERYLRLPALIRGVLKSVDDRLELGWHGDNGTTGVHLFKRIATDYAAMTEIFDWVKPCVYHLATGPRLRGNVSVFQRSLYADLDPDQALQFHYAVCGWDRTREPGLDHLADTSREDGALSEDFVGHEIGRAVRAVAGRSRVYAGLGIGVPVGGAAPEDPELTYRDTVAAFAAGADGLLIGREYDEIPIPNLQAIGRAFREHSQS